MDTDSFPSRRALLAQRGPRKLTERRLCHAVVDSAIPAWPSKLSQIPWVTPVIGTGTEEPRGLKDITRLAAEAIASLDESDEGAKQSARRFAESLIATRRHEDAIWPEASVEGSPELKGLGCALLACADLSNAYHQIQAWNSRAVTRDRDDVAVLRKEFPEWISVKSQFIAPAAQSVKALRALLPAPDEHGIAKVAADIADDLNDSEEPPTIRRTTLFTLTEYCWTLLSQPALPGWSDLLWRLYMRHSVGSGDARAIDKRSIRGPRPLGGDPSEILQDVRSSVGRLAGTSPDPGSAAPVHEAVAQLLLAQAGLTRRPGSQLVHSGESDTTLNTPLPVALATSLDLQLETSLALFGSRFVVAMPISVQGTHRSPKAASEGIDFNYPWWIGVRIEPDEQVATGGLLASDRHAWVSLHLTVDDPARAQRELRQRIKNAGDPAQQTQGDRIPMVVHLAGCPLLPLPDRAQAPDLYKVIEGALARGVDGVEFTIEKLTHHTLISEYAGIQRSLPRDRREATAGRGADFLQSLLIPPQKQARFFMLLGVQADDAAVRTRLALEIAQMIPHANDLSWKRHGLAINARMTGATEDLMTAIGLDVVEAKCSDFVADLAHLAAHFTTKDPGLLPPADNDSPQCPMKDDTWQPTT